MKLAQLLRAVRRYWWQGALLGALLGVAAALLLSSAPTYKATNTMVFEVAGSEKVADPYEGRIYATNLATSYAAMLSTPLVTVPVSEQIGDEAITPEHISTTSKVLMPDRNLIGTITYVGSEEEVARKVVELQGKELAKIVDETSDKYEGKQRVKIAQQRVVVTPSGPGGSLITTVLKGAVVALMAALAWILGRAILDNRVHDTEGLAEVTDASVIGRVADEGDAQALAAAVPFLGAGERPTLVVASTRRKESAARTASGLAKGLEAKAPGTVLLVDADLRKGDATASLGQTGSGLSEVLSGQANAAETIRPAGSGAPAVLPAGTLPPNPAELLASGRLAEELARLHEQYSTIVVATAPVEEGSDAVITATQGDGVVLVVGAGKVSRPQLKDTLDLLDAVQARMLGVVMSR